MAINAKYRFNPFNMLAFPTRNDSEYYKSLMWEHDRVNFVLRRLKLDKLTPILISRAKRATGDKRLAFGIFNELFEDFPLFLTCDNLSHLPNPWHLLPSAVFLSWFKSFRTVPIVKAFKGKLECYPSETRPIGMIFPRKGFEQGMIIHDGPIEKLVPPNTGYFAYTGKKGKQYNTLVVQQLAPMLDWVAKTWKPKREIMKELS